LSEYSTVYNFAYDVTLIGEKADGGSVSTTFVLDGLIDGPGGLDDFQSFALGSEWTDLVRVDFVGLNFDELEMEFNSYGFAMDNIELAPAPAAVPVTKALGLTAMATLLLGLGVMLLRTKRRAL
jgi:hypothetical protein